jgi:glycosyltransferase involved in cell wall biosynthesis
VHHKHHKPKELGNHPTILTVSRLAREKNIDLVIRALVRVPDAHLYILGDGIERARLEDEARLSGVLERVHFLGWVEDPSPYLQHADCFIQMSSYEGYGVSLIEALASGIPIVTTDVGVVSELPIDAVTIVPREEYALARAVRTTLDSITQTRRRQKDARASFLQKILSEDQYVQQYIELLQSCGS